MNPIRIVGMNPVGMNFMGIAEMKRSA